MTSDKQTASMEDYLESIALLKESGKPVSVTAISKIMRVKKPSVDSALTKLSEAGLVLHEKYGGVELTAKGSRLARDVYRRHQTLRHFLVDVLDVDPETAETDACRVEHVLSGDSISRLEKFTDYLLELHSDVHQCLGKFHRHIKQENLHAKLRKVREKHIKGGH